VHPGYGFLAENADFAQACADAGLVFIGPSASAILAMGNKAGAKRLMTDAGVPCVPGYHGEDRSDARMKEEAGIIGYPVMIKAAAGGGGRGMRRVDHTDGFLAALHSARSEAEHAFGSGELIQSLRRRDLIDRYVLLIHPLVLGSGRRLFPDGAWPADLRLVESVTTTTGVVIATYEPSSP